MTKKLTAKQMAFCEVYVEMNNNGLAAYKHVYAVKKDTTAKVNASKLLTKANVRAYIQELQDKATSDRIMSREEVLYRYTILARSNVKDVLKFNGSTVTLKDSEELTEEEAYTIQSVSSSKGKTDKLEIKQVDKIKAVEGLAKHYGLFNDKGSGNESGDGSGDDSGNRESASDRVRGTISRLKKR